MRKLLFIILVLVVLGIGFLHFTTPAELFFYHDTYRRLSYFPIVLGALWFGIWGGLILAVMSSLAFIPHVILYIGQGTGSYLSELTEIILYLAAGTVTGVIAGRESRLREKYRLLSEKLKLSALGQLSASLAHEIKNPLSSIKGTADILLDEFPDGHPKREFVEILLKETSRLNNTVEEVLQFSRRGSQDKKQANEETEPLSQVIDRVTSLLASHLQKKNISLTVTGWEEGKSCYVAGDKLSQVFLNIILNAIDAAPSKGALTVETKKDVSGCTVSVTDNGSGIPPELKERIFAPFYSTKDGGTGLGLSISKTIVESYGGTLTLSEAEGGGACFTVSLPSKDPDSIATKQAESDFKNIEDSL
jgi:signal transduction histidine kinase